MQRWIVAAVVFVVLLAGGVGIVGWKMWQQREYKRNLPTQIYLPIPTKPELLSTQREEVVTLLKEKLSDLALLGRVSKDSGFAKDMGFATDEAAATDLQQRLFVEIGVVDTPDGKVPSINVGFNCKVKEFGKMSKATDRLMADIGIILGRPTPQRPPF